MHECRKSIQFYKINIFNYLDEDFFFVLFFNTKPLIKIFLKKKRN